MREKSKITPGQSYNGKKQEKLFLQFFQHADTGELP